MYAGILRFVARVRAFLRPPAGWAVPVRAFGGGCTTWPIPTGALPLRPWPPAWCLFELDASAPHGIRTPATYASGVDGASTSAALLGARCARCGIVLTRAQIHGGGSYERPPACSWCVSAIEAALTAGAPALEGGRS